MDPKNTKVAYFSMEIALRSEVPNYAGGLGVLAADILKSCADLGTPAVGVTLMYHVSENSKFAFKPEEFATKRKEKVHMHIEDRNVAVCAWEYIIKGEKGEVPVYFLDTNLPENKRWDKDITKDLYAMDRYTRLCQESILGIAGVRILREMGYSNIKTFHLNEGHAALLTLALLKEQNFIDENVRKQCVFTTHTPVPAGHDRFDYGLVNDILTQKVPWHIRKLAGENDLNMTLLALNLSRAANSVSKKHRDVCQQMFPNYKFENITNGVHVQSWASKSMAALYDKYMKGWRSEPNILADALKIPSAELVEAHNKGKKDLIDFINSQPEFFTVPFDEIKESDKLDYKTLTITFARRFVPYKRPLLMFNDIERVRALGYGKIQMIYAGPYHSGDKFVIDTINQLVHLGRALRGQIKIAVPSDYKLDIAKYLVQGSDVWLNNPQPPMEASGTSGMKAAVNGALNCSIQDGWWIEGYKLDPKSGWAFGQEPSTITQPSQDRMDAGALYHTLKDVIDCYYNRKDEWVERMKHAIALGSVFNTHRCVKEYKEKMWLI